MTKQTRLDGTPKGWHREWQLFKHEGRPGLAMPDLPFWFAVKGDVRIAPSETKRDLLRTLDFYDSETDEERAAKRDEIARLLGMA